IGTAALIVLAGAGILIGGPLSGSGGGAASESGIAWHTPAIVAPVEASHEAEAPVPTPEQPQPIGDSASTSLRLDLRRSVVGWRGTKFRGRGEHSGVVRLSAGDVALCGGRVCGGLFIIDMTTIQVTDIPEDQPVPRNRLTNHLKSRDFFWSDRHPTATFKLRSATETAPGTLQVAGDLTIRDVTRSIAFPATITGPLHRPQRIEARFQIDRQDWGISYRFDPIRNEMVDDEVDFHLMLFVADGVAGSQLALPGITRVVSHSLQ
nr:YceI family protein [Chloroflexota bacterium]